MPSTNTTAPPQLPVELSEQIILTLWSSSLSLSERATLIKSSLLVSRTWNAIFTRVSSMDVHILSSSHGLQFVDVLLGNAGIYRLQMLDHLCQSITIQHANKSLLPGPENEREQPLGMVIQAILNGIFMSPERLPSLRRVSFQLQNYLMETIFTRNKFLYLAHQVEELEFNFTYSDDTDPLVVQAIKSRSFESFDIPADSMLHIRKLTVLGTSMGVAKELSAACGGLENLQIFEQDAWREVKATISETPAVASAYVVADDESDSEHESEDDGEDTFYDCSDTEERSWLTYEEVLKSSFTREELTGMLSAFQRQLEV
ncbi:hypothetical protein E1B28_007276 [Marasmius oreades]|uniref:Uncharacterized protein n=1 Tax=Marasmius oreades TaxID=181124 RepID=A0A9P7S1B7_9AGAR|nr:uncharacterized protein E1B28_007276 [Marasmius oreades]KAG7093611.1 hypothetical protein E1B28_007276 [Marasmius oreades]